MVNESAKRRFRCLGTAITVLGCAQLALYIIWLRRGAMKSFYFDPRIGFTLLDRFGETGTEGPKSLHWLSAFAEVILGFGISLKPRMIYLYLVTEVLFSLPSIVLFAVVLWANVSPAHGMSIGELLIPIPVFLLFSAAPWMIGYRLRKLTEFSGEF